MALKSNSPKHSLALSAREKLNSRGFLQEPATSKVPA